MKRLLSVLCIAFASLLLTGCGGVENFLYERKVSSVPGVILSTNIIWRTNTIVVPAMTNIITGAVEKPAEIQQWAAPEITFQYSPPTYVTNLVPRPTIDGGLEVVGALPIPFAGTGALIAGWLVHAYAGFRNKRKSEAISEALITGIERSRVFLQDTPEGKRIDNLIRQNLIDSQQSNGVYREVKALVDRYTDVTTKPAAPVPA